jgi:uncharacterized protein YjiS (DUF1127 family)
MQQPKTKEQAMNYNISSTGDLRKDSETSRGDSEGAPGPRRKRAGFMAIVFQPWQMLFEAMTMRKTGAALSALDDRMLKDIGISRSEITWRSRTANLPRKYMDPE